MTMLFTNHIKFRRLSEPAVLRGISVESNLPFDDEYAEQWLLHYFGEPCRIEKLQARDNRRAQDAKTHSAALYGRACYD